VLKIKLLLTAAVVAACSATPLLAQTQPAVPAQSPPAVTQPTPMIPPEAQPQTPALAQPPAGAPVSASPQMPPAMPAAQSPTLAPQSPVSDSERGTAVLLLERIQQVLDKAVAGKSEEEVTLDRGLIDEIRAEVAQVKLTMARPKQ
jgi:hypothetical protein